MSVFCLGAEQIDNLWPLFGHHLTRLETDGLLIADEIRKDLINAHKQVWGYQCGPAIVGVAITHLYETPRGKCCEVYAACGTETSPGQIDAIICEIEKWAKEIGCTRTRLLGRKGWLRKLNGYRQTGVILEKEI